MDNEMTSKERFLTALKCKQPDRVPIFDFLFSQKMYKEVLGYLPNTYNAKDAIDLSLAMGYDGVWIPFGYYETTSQKTELKENISVSPWGTTFQYTGASWPIGAPIDYPIKSHEDFENYEPPRLSSTGVRIIHEQVKDVLKIAKGRLATLGGVEGPFTPAWMLTGLELFSIFLHENPNVIVSLVKMATEYNLASGKAQIEGGVDGIFISDDWGFDTGLFISPVHFKKYVLPFYRQLVQTFKKMGIPVLMHNDGNLNQIIEDLVNTGIDAYHPVEKKAMMSLKEMKKRYSNRLCLIGNVDSSSTLPYGSEEKIEKEVVKCLRIAAPRGGYICASDHSLHDDIPLRSVLKMIETVKKYGKYPIDI